MFKKTVEEVITKGIQGTPELKSEERKLYLGTIRERVELALRSNQVMEPTAYREVTEVLVRKKDISLLLNGKISYSYLSKYIKIANQYGIPFSMINDAESDTTIGLVIAHKVAIDKESIFI